MESNSNDNSMELVMDNFNQSDENENIKLIAINNNDQILHDIFISNSNLYHKNCVKLMNFELNKNSLGPFNMVVLFNSRFFMNIIREFYLKLNSEYLNIYVSNQIIYFYGHKDRKLNIYVKINTLYISKDLVKIIEGHGQCLRVRFPIINFLKNCEAQNFKNKETFKIYFKLLKKNRKQKSINNINKSFDPFSEIQPEILKFDKDFYFEKDALEGIIIVETINNFKFQIKCSFAPPELSNPPNFPVEIYNHYIFSLNIDKSNNIEKVDQINNLYIFCNQYLCNFVSISENYYTYENTDFIEFKINDAFNYIRLYDQTFEIGNLFKYMIQFVLTKGELDACKILNKKTSKILFYSNKKDKYLVNKETDQDGNIVSSIIIKSSDNLPKIKNLEECYLYHQVWEEWIDYLSNKLPKDCINDLIHSDKNKNKKMGDKNQAKHRKKNSKLNSLNEDEGNINKQFDNEKNENEDKKDSIENLFLYSKKNQRIKKNKIEEDDNGFFRLGDIKCDYINLASQNLTQSEGEKNKNPFATDY